ncbi:hypothetical protein HU200_025747 [Digitaria exilis]|uniref:Pentatricopeptide repeat-containing protein n=1 Tax=Digitaria exilis TaxID=1010633 RepID=A0A835EW98_9POAL|nr:hypothetical protein HU200_025747 [Digitaria exilis]
MRRAAPCSTAGLGGSIGLDVEATAVSPHVSLVISKCAHIFESRGDTFDGNCSLQDVLKPGLWLSPETLRRFWRVSELKPEDFLDILIGFGSSTAQVRNARFYGICTDAHMLSQAESLLLSLNDNMALAVSSNLFSQVIQAYSEANNLEKSVALYDYARSKHLIPSVSCYQVILHLLMRNRKDELILRVYLDMLEVGFGSCTKGDVLDSVVMAFIKKDKFLQALVILRQLKSVGLKLSKGSLSTIVEEFNKKKDIGDMMNFLEEWRSLPDMRLCNRILASSCTNLGTDQAWLVFQRLEALGFAPDATTFGIFIFHSCREMKLKSAFIYLSECFSRHIKPGVCAYNAILSGVFREGLYRHAKYVFEDMVERKVTPNLSTYKILLAGYCWYRQFDGIEQILDTALHPDVNSELLSASRQGNVASALLVKDEAFQWGYDISSDSCAELFKALCVSPAYVIDAIDLMEEMPDIFDKLGAPNLNLVVQTLSRNGMSAHARLCIFALLKELCSTGYASVGCAMLEALKEMGMIVDNSLLFCVMEGFLKEQRTAESIGMYDIWINKRKELDAITYRSVLPSLPWLDTDRAKNLVESVLTMEFPEFSYCSCILKELVQTGNVKRVMPVLQESTPGKLSGTLLNSLLQAYGCLKNWRKLGAVLCVMLKMNENLSISTYRFLRRNNSGVHDLLKDMECNGISPDKTTYDFLVYGFHKSGDTDSSWMENCLKPSETSCDALVHGLCAMGRTCDARKILEMLTTLGSAPSYGMYRVVLDSYCRSSNLEKATALLHDMRQAGQVPNFEMHWSIISNFSITNGKTKGNGESILPNLFMNPP